MGRKKKTVEELRADLAGRPVELVRYAGSVTQKSTFRCLEDGCGHEWEATTDNVVRGGRGCPVCRYTKRMWKHSDLKSIFLKMGFEDLSPTYEGTTAKTQLKCIKPECGHVITPTYNSALQGVSCPECARRERGRTVEQMREELLDRNIELVQYAGTMNGGSMFRCLEDGHEWVTNLTDVIRGQGCKKCAGLIPLTEGDIRDRLLDRPVELLHYALGRNNKNSRFRCSTCSHEWTTTVGSVLSGSGCAVCVGNSPYSVDEIAYMARGKGLEMLTYGGDVNSPSRFRCLTDGYEYESSWAKVRSAENPCPQCDGRLPMPEADLVSKVQGRGIEVVEYGGRVSKKTRFRCVNDGHEWVAVPSQVLAGTGCPKCAGHLRLTVGEVQARLVPRPISLVNYAGNVMDKSAWFCHTCEQTWEAPADRILNSGAGCPHCADYGFKISKPAVFYGYRVTTRHNEFFGYGITGNMDRRNYHHNRAATQHGASLELVFTYEATGEAIQALERRLKETLPRHSSGVPGFVHESTLWDPIIVYRVKQEAEEVQKNFPAHVSEDSKLTNPQQL